MIVRDDGCIARGYVNPSFVDLSTGGRIAFGRRKNTLSYMSAEAMAAAFGGDPSYIPAKMGFIYGDKEEMPTDPSITRDQSWDGLISMLKSVDNSAKVDVQVVGFSFHPTLGGENAGSGGSSGSDPYENDGDYNHILTTGSNAITFHAVSNQSEGEAESGLAFTNGAWIYQAVLLGFHKGHYILSRVSLKDDDAYLQKPEGFEIALDWTVVFR